MTVPKLLPEWYHRRFQAVGRAQSRYLFLLLLITTYSVGLSFTRDNTVSVTFLGLTTIPTTVVNAATMLVLGVLLLAFFGALQAAREAFDDLLARLQDDGIAHPEMRHVDEHPNVADFLSYATFVHGKRTRFTPYGSLILYPAPAFVAWLWALWLWWQGVTACTLQPGWLVWLYRVIGSLLIIAVVPASVIFARRRWESFRTST